MNIDDMYELEEDLLAYFKLSKDELSQKLQNGQGSLVDIWQKFPGSISNSLCDYYEKAIGDEYIFDLANWHLTSTGDYIRDTCRLANDFATGIALDFGGGIGSHSLALALKREVKRVDFLEINPKNRDFFRWRLKKAGLVDKVRFVSMEEVKESSYDFVVALDILEHLENPLDGLSDISNWLKPKGLALMNFYFYKGDNNEFPFHHDDKEMVSSFMESLSSDFVEIFHKYLITARIYRPT